MPRSHRHPVRVRYAECDAQGHVFNAHYVAYFDLALTELWRDVFGSYGAMLVQGVDLVVAEVTARFRAPARFDDEIELEFAIERLGRTSMHSTQRISRDGDLLVEGTMVHVFVETGHYSKIPVPPAMRDRLNEG